MHPAMRVMRTIVGLCAIAICAEAQAPSASALMLVSDDSVDRLRINELSGYADARWMMFRSPSSMMRRTPGSPASSSFAIVPPVISIVSNSGLFYGQNDGALWAGKGLNLRALGGFQVSAKRVSLIVVPEAVRSANRPISIDPTDTRYAPAIPASRSRFSNPFNVYPFSIDLPWKLGDTPFTKIYPGQSSLTVSLGHVEIGAATENEWWGPAIHNPLVMSDNAPGFPHYFIRTSGPQKTRAGVFDARLMTGALRESDWFDNDPANDIRSLSAIGFGWSPTAKSPFTFGFTRSVFAPASGYGQAASRVLDAFRKTGHPNARAIADSAMVPGPDQIFSLFTRVVIPKFGLETYLEWGRADFPVSLRDFFEEPMHSRGYTAGAQWVLNAGADTRLRFLGEITDVEQSTTYRFRPQGSWYTSRAVPQGYTNEGQIIGAGLGPGSSGGFLAVDVVRKRWQGGVTWNRVRFDNDPFFLLMHANRCGHDVTVAPGARVSYTHRLFRIGVAASPVSRYNTFFQNKISCDSGGDGSDRSNMNLSVTAASFGW